MKKTRRTNIILFTFIGILVLATLFVTLVYNPNEYKITTQEGKCYVGYNPEVIFKSGVEKFPIIREIDCNLLEQLKTNANN